MFLITILVLGLFLVLFERLKPHYQKAVTLYIRSIPNKEEEYPSWYEYHSNNVFAQELCDEYLIISVALDTGVMIHAKDVEFLKEQEDQHAVIHNRYMEGHPAKFRYDWLKKLIRFLLLKTPNWFSYNVLGNIEVSFGDAMWVSQFVLGDFWSNILLFHWYEESEHGVITTGYFKKKYNAFIRLILSPIAVVVLALLWLLPVVMKILSSPLILLRVKTYLDLVEYLIAVALAVFVHVGDCVFFWILPFEHSLWHYHTVRDSFEKQVKERKIEFSPKDKKEYEY